MKTKNEIVLKEIGKEEAITLNGGADSPMEILRKKIKDILTPTPTFPHPEPKF